MKKITILFMSFLLVVGLTACNSGSKLTNEELLKKANELGETLESATIQMVMKMEMGIMGQTVNMDMDMTMDVLVKAQKSKGVVKIKMIGAGMNESEEFTMYTENTDEGYIVYGNVGGEWIKEITDVASIDTNVQLGLNNQIINAFKDAKRSETTFEGFKAYKLDGELPWSTFVEAANMMGEASDLGFNDFLGMDGNTKVPLSLYIDKKTNYMIGMTTDISDIVKAMITEQTDAQVDKLTVTATYVLKNHNAVKDIVIPQAAKDAPFSTPVE